MGAKDRGASSMPPMTTPTPEASHIFVPEYSRPGQIVSHLGGPSVDGEPRLDTVTKRRYNRTRV